MSYLKDKLKGRKRLALKRLTVQDSINKAYYDQQDWNEVLRIVGHRGSVRDAIDLVKHYYPNNCKARLELFKTIRRRKLDATRMDSFFAGLSEKERKDWLSGT